MKVGIKELKTPEVGSKGVEFEIKTPDGNDHKGDVFVDKTGLVWCSGRTTKRNGKRITWDDFITFMNGRA
jgi:hypothetical protein